MALDGERTEHPSYGKLSITRTNGGNGSLFGSSVFHHEKIRLSISRASHVRDLSHDWYMVGDELIEVEMSPAQFAEAITTLNVGTGVCCTIARFGGELIPPPTYVDKRHLFRNEFEQKARGVGKKLDEVMDEAERLAESKSATKSERKELLEKIRMVRMEISQNMPFLTRCFDEQMEKSEAEAKATIDAFLTHAVTTAGLEAIRQGSRGVVALPEPNGPEG